MKVVRSSPGVCTATHSVVVYYTDGAQRRNTLYCLSADRSAIQQVTDAELQNPTHDIVYEVQQLAVSAE
jgi:hypothetical protein